MDLKLCHNISTFNIKHLVNLKYIYCKNSTINDATINNFPVSLLSINLEGCNQIATFSIHHLVNLKVISCGYSTINDASINDFPVSLELINLIGCQNFDIQYSTLGELEND
uniref:Uncharacterized protein n=1 Tax=Cacopsylla melanoneura TaxID=428564 RepID=A0A8D9DQR2_9HEMI